MRKKIESKNKNNALNLSQLINVPTPVNITVGDINFIVKPRLNIGEVGAFVEFAISNTYNKNEEEINYSAKDFAFGLSTIVFYTDLDIPEDVDEQYKILTCTNILDKIKEHIDEKQYWHLLDSIDEQLKFEEQKILSQYRFATQEYIEQIKYEASNIISAFIQFAESFKDIDPNAIADIIPKLTAMTKIDEKTLVDAVLSYKKDNGLEVVK